VGLCVVSSVDRQWLGFRVTVVCLINFVGGKVAQSSSASLFSGPLVVNGFSEIPIDFSMNFCGLLETVLVSLLLFAQ